MNAFKLPCGHVLNLKKTNTGMTCEEYSILVIAGPCRSDLPERIIKKMNQHEETCEYHQSETWRQSAVSTPTTPEMEEATLKLVKELGN